MEDNLKKLNNERKHAKKDYICEYCKKEWPNFYTTKDNKEILLLGNKCFNKLKDENIFNKDDFNLINEMKEKELEKYDQIYEEYREIIEELEKKPKMNFLNVIPDIHLSVNSLNKEISNFTKTIEYINAEEISRKKSLILDKLNSIKNARGYAKLLSETTNPTEIYHYASIAANEMQNIDNSTLKEEILEYVNLDESQDGLFSEIPSNMIEDINNLLLELTGKFKEIKSNLLTKNGKKEIENEENEINLHTSHSTYYNSNENNLVIEKKPASRIDSCNVLIEKFNNQMFYIYADEDSNVKIEVNDIIQSFTTKGDIRYFSKNLIDNTLYFSCTTKFPHNVCLFSLSFNKEGNNYFEELPEINTNYLEDSFLYSSIFKHKNEILIGVNQYSNSKFTIYEVNGKEKTSIKLENPSYDFHSVFLDSIIIYSSSKVDVYSIDNCELTKSFTEEKESKWFYHGLLHKERFYVSTKGGIVIFDWNSCKMLIF